MFSLFTDFKDMSTFTPHERNEASTDAMFKEVISWSKALKTIR